MQSHPRTELKRYPLDRSIYLFGGTSLVGWNIYKNFHTRLKITPFANSHNKNPAIQSWYKYNLENLGGIIKINLKPSPDIFIYCAGVCDVHKCAQNKKWAKNINVDGLKRVIYSLKNSVRLIYLSSDHLFSGNKPPYFEDSSVDPISFYGETRAMAEEAIKNWGGNFLILRYGLGVGPSLNGRTGHLNWLQYRTIKKLPITVVKDEFRSAVWLKDLVSRILDLSLSSIRGTRHLVSPKAVSRLDLAQYLNRKFKIGAKILSHSRKDCYLPHLGNVNLSTQFADSWATPLKSVIPMD